MKKPQPSKNPHGSPASLIISVAPVSHDARARNNPLTSKAVAEETLRAWQAGAGMVHLHVRDARGKQVATLKEFNKTVRQIRTGCDIVVQGSTGGVSTLTAAQRSVALKTPGVEVATLNMGSTNLFGEVYANSPSDIRYWAKSMLAKGIKPECCIFEAGMVATVDELVEEGLLEGNTCYNFSLGFPGAMPATRRNLSLLLDSIPAGAPWFYVQHGSTDFRAIALAIALGGHVRVGFEDSFHLTPERRAKSNAELVEKTVSLARMIGREVASPAEARDLLGLQSISMQMNKIL